MTPPPRSDPSGPDELRRLLLAAAREILREPDTPLDLRKVAERAGKSRTAPYLVFGKESEGGGVLALRIAVAAEGAAEMAEAMERAARGVDDAIDAFHQVALAFLAFVEREPRLFRLMYGPEINAVSRLGEDGFRAHPEFSRLLKHRSRAGRVVSERIERGQDEGLLRPESPGEGFLETPRSRYLQIAWSSMIGVALLRDDQLLQAIDWRISREQAARLIVESLFGLDPRRVGDATRTFLESRGVDDPDDEGADAAPPEAPAGPAPAGAEPGERPGEGRGSGPPIVRSGLGFAVRAADAPLFDDLDVEVRSRSTGRPRADDDVGTRELSLREERHEFVGEVVDAEAPPDEAPPDTAPPEPASPAADAPVRRWAQRSSPPRPPLPLGEALDLFPGLRRAAFSNQLRNGPRILWIDDHPEWIGAEVDTLRHLGAEVVLARTTPEAVRVLAKAAEGRERPVRAIVSDIARGSRPDAGVRALPELARAAPGVPVIFFVGEVDPERGVPEGAAGLTNRTDELLHLIVDALEGR